MWTGMCVCVCVCVCVCTGCGLRIVFIRTLFTHTSAQPHSTVPTSIRLFTHSPHPFATHTNHSHQSRYRRAFNRLLQDTTSQDNTPNTPNNTLSAPNTPTAPVSSVYFLEGDLKFGGPIDTDFEAQVGAVHGVRRRGRGREKWENGNGKMEPPL